MAEIFGTSFSERQRWRTLAFTLAQGGYPPVFKPKSDPSRSLGFQLEYQFSAGQQYLAISHSWTDRTGSGDTIHVKDLAPWEITMSPSKRGLLTWLLRLQEDCMREHQVTLWFWLDLFCIDQSWEDERLFATQLQQIPQVFAKADGCVALIVSRPCEEARHINLTPRMVTDGDPNSEWKALREWLGDHSSRCSCTPLTDAWLTRVWTRQELLYSSNIWLCPAAEWLEDEKDFLSETWTHPSPFYHNIDAKKGLDEFASCLITWAEKNRRTYSSAELVSIALNLIRGIAVPQSISDLRESLSPEAMLEEWFAYNWTMILNGSIRRTTKARDAIISQMLLLPGYKAPLLPASMSLQQIAHDASAQFRDLTKCYQLVPLDLRIWSANGRQLYRATWEESIPQPFMADVLEAVGSPCQVALPKNLPPSDVLHSFSSNQSSLLAYKPFCRTNYTVLYQLDISNTPLAAIDFFLELGVFWDELSGCAMESRVWDRLKAFSTSFGQRELHKYEEAEVSRQMVEIVWFMLQGWLHKSKSSTDIEKSATELQQAALKQVLPPLTAANINYENEAKPSHVNLLFGALANGSSGEVLGLGIEKGIQREIGVIGDISGDELSIRAFGVIMAENKDPVLGSRAAFVNQTHTQFWSVKSTHSWLEQAQLANDFLSLSTSPP